MFQTILSFLGHDGIRIIFFLFVLVGNIVKSRARAAKQNEAKLRGGTAIRDFSTPDVPPAATPFSSGSTAAPKPIAKPKGAPVAPFTPPKPTGSARKPPASPPASPPGSPWSSNQDPFK